MSFCAPPAQEEEPEKYQAHFAKYIEAGVEPGEVEDLYKEVRHPAPATWGRGRAVVCNRGVGTSAHSEPCRAQYLLRWAWPVYCWQHAACV